jgi:molecular chaperone GrpE
MRKAAWADGAKLSFQKLKGALESEGVQEIEALGQPFDPRFHQAVMRRPGQEDIVLEEVQKGYIMNGRVLRPTMVVVGAQEVNEGSEQ